MITTNHVRKKPLISTQSRMLRSFSSAHRLIAAPLAAGAPPGSARVPHAAGASRTQRQMQNAIRKPGMHDT